MNAQKSNKDTTTYDLTKKIQSLRFHEGENFVKAIKNDSLYGVMENGKVTKWFFRQKNGEKYYAQGTSENTSRIDIFPCQRGIICIDTPWGRSCFVMPCSPHERINNNN